MSTHDTRNFLERMKERFSKKTSETPVHRATRVSMTPATSAQVQVPPLTRASASARVQESKDVSTTPCTRSTSRVSASSAANAEALSSRKSLKSILSTGSSSHNATPPLARTSPRSESPDEKKPARRVVTIQEQDVSLPTLKPTTSLGAPTPQSRSQPISSGSLKRTKSALKGSGTSVAPSLNDRSYNAKDEFDPLNQPVHMFMKEKERKPGASFQLPAVNPPSQMSALGEMPKSSNLSSLRTVLGSGAAGPRPMSSGGILRRTSLPVGVVLTDSDLAKGGAANVNDGPTSIRTTSRRRVGSSVIIQKDPLQRSKSGCNADFLAAAVPTLPKWVGEEGNRHLVLRGSRIVRESELRLLFSVYIEVLSLASPADVNLAALRAYMLKLNAQNMSRVRLASSLCSVFEKMDKGRKLVFEDFVKATFPSACAEERDFLAQSAHDFHGSLLCKKQEDIGTLSEMISLYAPPVKQADSELINPNVLLATRIYKKLDKKGLGLADIDQIVASMAVAGARSELTETALRRQLGKVLAQHELIRGLIDQEQFLRFVLFHLNVKDGVTPTVSLPEWMCVVEGYEAVLAKYLNREID